MLETYKAKLRGNRVVWNGETPDAAKNRAEVDVYITIVERGSEPQVNRPSGLAAGESVVPDDFDAPLPDEILSGFEN
jgi:hypothetical protein